MEENIKTMEQDKKKQWQDEHIKKYGDKFICYDECGLSIIMVDTIEEAREHLEIYDQYVLNNITD